MTSVLLLMAGLLLIGGGLATMPALRRAFAATPPPRWARGEDWREILLLLHFTATVTGACLLIATATG
ncbi:hypothetical protein [Oceanibaculum pacificum]|uniref:Uncharacterized protein n=1 Tax=Oceanibaculum pacificum TaxID=580166 RepID=A0A154WEX9_9PROT|nr:hypothetical protein [Oceanibaculum pacificum]KZD12081.1 hypothetical protein AUP43_05430 [Oceanibaculum pacificum]